MKAVQINFSEDLLARFDADELVRERSRSEVVRRIVEAYLHRRDQKKDRRGTRPGLWPRFPADRGGTRRLGGGGRPVARNVRRGDVWLHRFGAPDRRRPVFVLTRDDVVNRMHTVLVAPVTTAIRGI